MCHKHLYCDSAHGTILTPTQSRQSFMSARSFGWRQSSVSPTRTENSEDAFHGVQPIAVN